jgi:tetratricopeptide (TPR) repeat protein
MANHSDFSSQLRSSGATNFGLTVGRREKIQRILLGLVDWSLAGCLLVVPACLGGNAGIGRMLLVVLAIVAASSWSIRQSLYRHAAWKPTWTVWLILLVVGMLLFQLVQLPPSVCEFFSPAQKSLLPTWSDQVPDSIRMGSWNTISLEPDQTRDSLIIFLAYGLIFLVTVNRIATVVQIERLLIGVATAAVLMAGFGLIQYYFGDGRFFWFYSHPYSNTSQVVKGAFVNRNHFAQFLALGIGPLLWWLFQEFNRVSSKKANRFQGPRFSVSPGRWIGIGILSVAIIVVAFASLMSLSRGGNVALLMAVVSCTITYTIATRGSWKLATGVLILTVCLIGVLSNFETENAQIENRVGDMAVSLDFVWDKLEVRRKLWETMLESSAPFLWFGGGAGTFRELCPVFLDNIVEGNREFTHAENGYIQLLMENGAAGILLLIIGIGSCLRWCLRGIYKTNSTRLAIALAAITGSLIASAVHSLTDFIWYIPGCMVITVILAAAACRGYLIAIEETQAKPARWIFARRTNLMITFVVLAIGVGMISRQLGPMMTESAWDDYRRSGIAIQSEPIWEHPEQMTPEDIEEAIRQQEWRVEYLEKILAWQGDNSRAHEALAHVHLTLFDLRQLTAINPMSLLNLADAMRKSQGHFASPEAREVWLERSIGPHRVHLNKARKHFRIALACCPLNGQAYVQLAKLSFLDELPAEESMVLLDQATRVRPFEGPILFEAANQAFLIGHYDTWHELVKRAFAADSETRKKIINSLVAAAPPEHLGTVMQMIIKQFQPKLDGLAQLLEAAELRASEETLRPLRIRLIENAAAEAEKNREVLAARQWQMAAVQAEKLGRAEDELVFLQKAYNNYSNSISIRYHLGKALLASGQYEPAAKHLRWCLQLNPDNTVYKRLYQKTLASQMDQRAQKRASNNSFGLRKSTSVR